MGFPLACRLLASESKRQQTKAGFPSSFLAPVPQDKTSRWLAWSAGAGTGEGKPALSCCLLRELAKRQPATHPVSLNHPALCRNRGVNCQHAVFSIHLEIYPSNTFHQLIFVLINTPGIQKKPMSKIYTILLFIY